MRMSHVSYFRKKLRAVAKCWLEAGADIITTATYQATLEELQSEFELSHQQANASLQSSVTILDQVRSDFWATLSDGMRKQKRFPIIAISFGPLAATINGIDEFSDACNTLSYERFLKFHRHRATVFANIRMNVKVEQSIFCYETIGCTSEAIAITKTMSGEELNNIPYWISFQCRNSKQMAGGESVYEGVLKVLSTASNSSLVGIGVNCVLVSHIVELVRLLQQAIEEYEKQSKPQFRMRILAYPNSGEVWRDGEWTAVESRDAATPSLWADTVQKSGAFILGGCCRTGPQHIHALKEITGK